MDIYFLLKVAALVIGGLLLTYLIINKVLTFIVRFSDQLRKTIKNAFMLFGIIYMIGLIFKADFVVNKSLPFLEIISKTIPGIF